MQMDCDPLWGLKQRNLEAKAALSILNYHDDAFWVMLQSMCKYWADSSSFAVLNSPEIMHQVISTNQTRLKQMAITESSKLSHTTMCHH